VAGLVGTLNVEIRRHRINSAPNVRFRGECVAKLFAALRASNNRIEANGPLNQYCALAVDIESMLRGRALKIVLQHIHPESGHCSDEVTRPLSANSRHRACGFKMRPQTRPSGPGSLDQSRPSASQTWRTERGSRLWLAPTSGSSAVRPARWIVTVP
jgi:hypothetical protein